MSTKISTKMTKREIIKKVTAIILKYAKPERIFLHGSQVTGDATPGSDIDIAYLDAEFKENHLIKEEVDALPTLLKIDVVNLSRTEERFKNRVLSTGKILYSATKKLRTEDGLHNFTKALERFASVVDRKKEFAEDGYEDIYLDLVVKRFEFTFEMSWKAIKRYMDFIGIGCINPRNCFKEAFSQGLLHDEEIWLDMIEMRNLSSHTYNEDDIKAILEKLTLYKEAFQRLKQSIQTQFQTQ